MNPLMILETKSFKIQA